MIAYSIGILPLIKNLKRDLPGVTHSWYANNVWALGMFAIIEAYFHFITLQGPGCGYFLKRSKIVLIVHPENLEAGKFFSTSHMFKVCTVAHYIGSYIGDNESKCDWMKDHTLMWERNICTISKTVGKCPHESYAAVVCVIQLEWMFIQWVTMNRGGWLWEWKRIFRRTFCFILSLKRKITLNNCRRYKYNAGQ